MTMTILMIGEYDMKYLVKDRNEIFERVESDGETLLVVKSNAQQVHLNRTAHKIYNLMYNFEDMKELLKAVEEIYPDVDSRILKNDIFNLLKLMEIYDIIQIVNEEKGNSGYQIKFVGDKSYRELSKFITNIGLKNDIHFCHIENKEYYDTFSLRQRTMTGKEYCVSGEYNEEIKACMMYLPPRDGYLVMTISALFFDSDVKEDEIVKWMSSMIQKVIYTNMKETKKIRISIKSCIGINQTIMSAIEMLGFKEECILKNETINGDMIMYKMEI